MQTAAAYIRVSTEDQVEYSPESQRKLIYRYAAQHGWQVPAELVFVDEGISGRKAEKRPAFMRMIAAAKQKPKPFSAILVYSFSRFARNREDSVVYKRMLRRDLGIELISISQELGNDKTAMLVEALLEAMDEYYSVDLGENVKRGMMEKVERGEPVTIPPFGYRMEGKRYAPSPQAPVVEELFRLFAAGAGYRELAARLNAMGIQTTRGNPWEPRAVAYLLQNPVYRGKIRWSAQGRAGRSLLPRVETQGNHPPLVDERIWLLAQQRAAQLRQRPRREGNRPGECGPLQGLVRCGACGGRLVQAGRSSYQCGNYAKGKCRDSHSISRALLWRLICPALVEDIGALQLPQPAQVLGGSLALASQKQAAEQLKRARAAYCAGIDTLEEYASKKKELQKVLLKSEPLLEPSCRTLGEYLKGPAAGWEKNRILSRLIAYIEFNKPYHFRIYYDT